MKSVSKKDNLFAASRFVLPEHKEAYLQFKEDQKLVPKPTLEYDEIAEINYKITDSKQYGIPLTVRYWEPVKRDLGKIHTAYGSVKTVDTVYKQIKLVDEEDFQWIDLNRIVEVRS